MRNYFQSPRSQTENGSTCITNTSVQVSTEDTVCLHCFFNRLKSTESYNLKSKMP